jgi:large subunit ribosomal protein L32
MSVPKKRTSSRKTRTRRSQDALPNILFVRCSQESCRAYKMPHIVCKKCGFYKNKPILKTSELKA